MMSKLLLGLLAFGAFLYAAWLVVTGRPLPAAGQRGWRRRFILATLLMVGFLNRSIGAESKGGRTCYIVAPTPPVEQIDLMDLMKATWRVLDPEQSEGFRQVLERTADQGIVRYKVADMLAITYQEIALHKQMTRGEGPKMTCYLPNPMEMTLQTTREQALKQVELLRQAQDKGTINALTTQKAMSVLSREVEMMYLARAMHQEPSWIQGRLMQEYKSGDFIVGDSANVAAEMIVELEGAGIKDFTPERRLSEMKKQIELLLKRDDTLSQEDWMDPSLQPNIDMILHKAGLLVNAYPVLCYKASLITTEQRSQELNALQKQILDEKVQAGVLDAEVAKKAMKNPRRPVVDYATEEELRAYQRQVRRVMRLLYKAGEVPSPFVERVERAADVEIIDFSREKALKNDVRYYLRSVQGNPRGIMDEVLKALESRKLIGPAKNHRLIMDYPKNNPDWPDSVEIQKRIKKFASLLDSDERITLAGDEMKIILYQLPQTEVDYRMTIRRVCRVMVAAEIATVEELGHVEYVIGIPIAGTVER